MLDCVARELLFTLPRASRNPSVSRKSVSMKEKSSGNYSSGAKHNKPAGMRRWRWRRRWRRRRRRRRGKDGFISIRSKIVA